MYSIYYFCTFLVCFLFEHSGKLLRSYCWGTKSRRSILNWKSSKRRILLCWTAAWITHENIGDTEADQIVKFESKLDMSVPRMAFLIPRNLVLRQGGQLSAAFLTQLSFSYAVFNLFTCPQKYCNAGHRPPESLDPAPCCLIGCTVHCCSWMGHKCPCSLGAFSYMSSLNLSADGLWTLVLVSLLPTGF